jgi:hypothetical protein
MGKTFPLSRETKPEKQKAHGLNAHAQTTILLYHKLRFFLAIINENFQQTTRDNLLL